MASQKCGPQSDSYNWGRCPDNTKKFCSALNNGICQINKPTTFTNNIYDYKPITTQKCGYHNKDEGRCQTAENPCCSSDTGGYCGGHCNPYNSLDYQYLTPTSTLPDCKLSEWGACNNAPTCNGNQISTSGTHSRYYIQNSNCTIPVNQEITSKSCVNTCNPVPERCGINNNNKKCNYYNNCCSKEGFCGIGSTFCNNNTNYMFCGVRKPDEPGYWDHQQYCFYEPDRKSVV